MWGREESLKRRKKNNGEKDEWTELREGGMQMDELFNSWRRKQKESKNKKKKTGYRIVVIECLGSGGENDRGKGTEKAKRGRRAVGRVCRNERRK